MVRHKTHMKSMKLHEKENLLFEKKHVKLHTMIWIYYYY